MSLRNFVLALVVMAVLTTGVGIVYARQQHRQSYVQLTGLLRERDEINIEFSRLQLEQATWAETNRIEQVATERVGMVFPSDAQVVVIKP